MSKISLLIGKIQFCKLSISSLKTAFTFLLCIRLRNVFDVFSVTHKRWFSKFSEYSQLREAIYSSELVSTIPIVFPKPSDGLLLLMTLMALVAVNLVLLPNKLNVVSLMVFPLIQPLSRHVISSI